MRQNRFPESREGAGPARNAGSVARIRQLHKCVEAPHCTGDLWTGWPIFPKVFVGGSLLGGAGGL